MKLVRLWPIPFVAYLFLWRVFDRHLPAIWGMRWELALSMILIVIAAKAAAKFQDKLFILACGGLFFNLFRISGMIEYIQLVEFIYGVYLAAILTFLLILTNFERMLLILGFTSAGVFTAGSLLVWKLLGHDITLTSPVFENPSMAGSFIAISMAFCTPYLAVLMYVPVLLTHTYTGIIAGAVVLYLKPTLRTHNWGNAAIVLSLITLTQMSPYKITTGNGRYHIWYEALSWWWHNPWEVQVFGVGLGSVGPLLDRTDSIIHAIQQQAGDTHGDYLWLHSDWVQILFEQGILGLVSALTIFGLSIFKAIKKERGAYLAAILAYGITMLTNFPWHWPIHALFGAVIMVCILSLKESNGAT